MTSPTEFPDRFVIPQSGEGAGGLGVSTGENPTSPLFLDSPDSGSSSASGWASPLRALRNDNGEVVWLLTEKAMAHFSRCRVPPARKGAQGQQDLVLGTVECESGDRNGQPCG